MVRQPFFSNRSSLSEGDRPRLLIFLFVRIRGAHKLPAILSNRLFETRFILALYFSLSISLGNSFEEESKRASRRKFIEREEIEAPKKGGRRGDGAARIYLYYSNRKGKLFPHMYVSPYPLSRFLRHRALFH